MLNNATIEKLHILKLPGMAEEMARQLATPMSSELPFEQRVRSMVDREMTQRDHKRLQYLLKRASLPLNACVEDIDYRSPRNLDKAAVLTLTSLDWIRNGHSLVITGPTGTGKSWLACALANQACREGLSCYFVRVPILMENLSAARATTNFVQRLQQLGRFDLLILDDWGIEPFSKRAENDVLELIDNRLGKCSLLITSQMPMSIWHDTFHNKAVADALMDRIVHGSYHIQLSGVSLRKTQALDAKISRKQAE
ncbi:IS21-like element helper ATPase IstB [Vogesella indigofera]|uniref:IS21-like element helper ATPase IstB n=1 Tax=Vogesella indigofera TaxID=45465 RepID=UPI00234E5B74|nr:IS21-like element helper ATPase IstB [Vogesella indigofera]MDC7712392.1 IS21-like element helper ATPase IstB [Vogesella indigofera]